MITKYFKSLTKLPLIFISLNEFENKNKTALPFINNTNDTSGIWMILLTASNSPKLSLAALMMKLLAVKKRPEKNAIAFPKTRRVIRP